MPTRIQRSKWFRLRLRTAALAGLATAIIAAVFFRQDLAAIHARYADPLPILAASRTPDADGYVFKLPESSEPTLIHIGPAPTPVSITHSVTAHGLTHLFLYETSGEMTLITVDRKNGQQREQVVPGVQLTYAARYFPNDPDSLWFATCLKAALVRRDRKSGKLETIGEFPGESHAFCLDRHQDGSIYVGTYPHHKCFRLIQRKTKWRMEELAISPSVIGGRTYLHGLFAAGRFLFLHYGSPGRLVRYDLKTKEARVLLDSKRGFLPFRMEGGELIVSNGTKELRFDRTGRELRSTQPQNKESPTSIRMLGHTAFVNVGEHDVAVSLRPRHNGMRITALSRGLDGKLYGGTYWNHWLFRIDGKQRQLAAVAELPGASGEFFTSVIFNDRLIVPNYQGEVYSYDIRKRPSGKIGVQNPRRLLTVPDAHYGLCCATDHNRVYYATQPNYHQRGGMLVSIDSSNATRMRKAISNDATVGSLCFLNGRLFGGTVTRLGMGLGKAVKPIHPPRIIEFDPETLEELRSVSVGKRADEIVGVVPMGDSRLLCATLKGLFAVDLGDSLTVRSLSSYRPIQRWCRCRIRKLIRYEDDLALILTDEYLLSVSLDDGETQILARMPRKFQHGIADDAGNLYLVDDASLYLLSAQHLTKLLGR